MRSSAITSALIAKLAADAELTALAPDGVFKNVAGASMASGGGTATRFVIVSLIVATNARVFHRRAYTDALYLVEARMRSSAGGDVNAAAARIDALLDPQPPDPPATLEVPGFALMALYQDEPTESTEVDDADRSIRWHRGGGRYHVWAAPAA